MEGGHLSACSLFLRILRLFLQDQNITYTNLGDENQKGKQVFCFWVVGKIICHDGHPENLKEIPRLKGTHKRQAGICIMKRMIDGSNLDE